MAAHFVPHLANDQGAEKIFGYTEAEVKGQSLTLLLPSRYHDPHSQGLQRV